MIDLESQIAKYVLALDTFRIIHNLPGEWFATPDHVAIKCADTKGYESEMQSWLSKAAKAQFIRMNGRYLGSLQLLQPFKIGVLGQVDWLEIMEPRREKIGIDPVGIDHVEFCYTDFKAAATLLNARGIPYEKQENPGHQWLSIMAKEHEFKLTNKSLAAVVADELSAGEATTLKP